MVSARMKRNADSAMSAALINRTIDLTLECLCMVLSMTREHLHVRQTTKADFIKIQPLFQVIYIAFGIIG
jgi:hypothetical protein